MNSTVRRCRLVRFSCFAAIVGILNLNGCSSPTSEIQFLIPDGYIGPVIVIEDEGATNVTQRNQVYEIHVPESGIVTVRSAHFFSNWSRVTARYANGNSIPYDFGITDDESMMVSDAAIALRPYGRVNSQLRYFVGKKDDAEKFDFGS